MNKRHPINPLETIPERILANLNAHGQRVLLRLLTREGRVEAFSYAQVVDRASEWTALYLDRGLKASSRVVILLQHSLDLYAAYLGALLGGMVPVMFAFPSPKFSEEEYFKTFPELIKNATPELIVSFAELRNKLAANLSGKVAVCVPSDVAGVRPVLIPVGCSADQTAFLQYSSGTTGLKKGVAISHRALLWQIDQYAAAIDLQADDVIVSWLPLYHDMGLICCFFLPVLTGTPLVAMSPFDWVSRPVMLLRALTDYAGTLCWLPNFAYNFMAKNVSDRDLEGINLESVRGLVNCSEPILTESHRVFLKRFTPCGLKPEALAGSYAMAENTFAVTSGGFGHPLRYDCIDQSKLASSFEAAPVPPIHPKAQLMVCSGRILPETAVEIVSKTGEVLPDRYIGEIVVQSPCLFQEYYRNPEATALSVHGGKFRTGDLGYLADGHLFVTGRKKDLIIIAGKNLYPQDIEAVVNEVEGVVHGRCVAFGLANAEKGTEELIILAETKQTDAQIRAAIEQEIYERVASQTETVPGDIRLVDHMWLLKSSSGKIARSGNRQRYLEVLRDQPASRISAAPLEPPASPATKPAAPSPITDKATRVLACVNQVLEKKNLARGRRFELHDPLITSGLIDSLTLVSLVMEIESEFGITIPPSSLEVSHFNTGRKIVTMIEHLLSAKDNSQLLVENRVVQYDDRDKACFKFQEYPQAVDLLILGSSKAKYLSPATARELGYTAFNFWVNSSRAEDWYCITRFVLDHNKGRLKAIVLSVDIEAFSNAEGIDIRLRESSQLTPYLDEKGRDGGIGGIDLAQKEIPADGEDLNRFQSLLLQYKKGMADRDWLNEAAIPAAVAYRVFVPDESASHEPPLEIKDPHDRDAAYTLRMKGFTQLSPGRGMYFDRLSRLCVKNQVTLACCISPLHPELDHFLSTHTSYGRRLSEFRGWATSVRHPFFRFFDTPTPAVFSGYVNDFENAAHMGPANSKLLLRHILSQLR
ncbi:MAG: AMP-binding protein [Verrucomicrobia bacterium]|nr:AMP-binding protein [Verrucomicrobiota bacterium]